MISIMQTDGYANSYNTSSSNRFSFKKVAVLVAGVVLLLIVVISLFSVTGSSNSKTAKSFAELVQKKDAEDSYAMTSSSFRKVTTKEDWNLTVDRIAEFLEGKLVEQESSGSNNLYTFQPNGSKYLITVGVVEEQDAMKVNFFNSSLIR